MKLTFEDTHGSSLLIKVAMVMIWGEAFAVLFWHDVDWAMLNNCYQLTDPAMDIKIELTHV